MAKSKNNAAHEADGDGMGIELASKMEEAKATIGKLATIDEAREFELAAQKMRETAATSNLADAHRLELVAAELAMRGMRRFGELLPEPAPGTFKSNDARLSHAREADDAIARFSPHYVSRRRAIAAIPTDAFEKALADARAAGRPASQTALLDLAKRLKPATPAAYNPAAEDRKRARARRRALVDAAAALDAAGAEFVRVCMLTRGDASDAFAEASDAVDAVRDKLLADARVAELRAAFGDAGPPVSAVARERRLAEEDANWNEAEAYEEAPEPDFPGDGMTEEEIEALKDAFDREHGLNKYAAQGPQPKADAPGGDA